MAPEIDQPWLREPSLRDLLALLSEGGEEARVNGGAVRNGLLGEPVNDVDISTTLVPRDVISRLKAAGHKAVPTGIEHGTVTAVLGEDAYEVTTLRADVDTDGRRATVLYGRDWEQDARRRDFTMNALYVDADGVVFDPLDGLEDLQARRIRFIDNAEQRIREDYLRILRFFRFFAWYGSFRPDADGLKACTRLKHGLSQLSAERIWQELSKMLAAPDPSRAVLWMRTTGVLGAVLPESEKWGIDALPGVVETGSEQGWEPDALLRLMAILPPQADRIEELCDRLKLPNKVRNRLTDWAESVVPPADTSKAELAKLLYRGSQAGITDRLRLAMSQEAARDNVKLAKKFGRLLKQSDRWHRPKLPVRGQDILNQDVRPGPEVSEKLKKIEERWVESGFTLSREELLG